MSATANESSEQPSVSDNGDRKAETPSQQIVLDDTGAMAAYANFCRISGTPEELVLDFALNAQPSGQLPETLKIGQRVILNFYTAKRLLGALQMAVQRHEATFGMLETDIQKRVHPRTAK